MRKMRGRRKRIRAEPLITLVMGEGWRLGQDGGFGGHQADREVQVREVATEDLQNLNFLGHFMLPLRVYSLVSLVC